MTRFCKRLVLTAIIIFMGVITGLSSEKRVKIATLMDFPPYCFQKPDSPTLVSEILHPGEDSVQLQGYSWDVVRESFHIVGYTIELYAVPWSRGMLYVEKGKTDLIFPALKTKVREHYFNFSQESVDETNIVVHLPRDVKFEWNGLDSIKGKVIATVRGWAYGKKWEDATDIINDPTSTILQGFTMLDKKRVFGVVGYENSFDYVLKSNSIFQKYWKSPPLDYVSDYIIGRKAKETLVLLESFDEGKRKIQKKGKLDQIKIKWVSFVPKQLSD